MTELDGLPLRGGCGGFAIHSALTFATLRPGTGQPLRVVHVPTSEERTDRPLVQWAPRPGNPFAGRLHRDGSGYAFWASDAGWFMIDTARGVIGCSEPELTLRRELRLFGVPLSISAFAAGDVSLHGAAVELSGRAVLLAGPSQYGKTTLATAFAAAGHRLLSEDSSRCGTAGGPHLFPGPALARLRADVADAVTIPDAEVSQADGDRHPLLIPAERRGDATAVPLHTIVLLRESTGAVELRSYDPRAAARDLLALTFVPPEREALAAAFERLVDLIAAVEVVEIHRPKRRDALPAVVSLLERHVEAGP